MGFHRRNLPHLHYEYGQYFITYRLANSIPNEKLRFISHQFEKMDFEEYRRLFIKFEKVLESENYGIKYLRNPTIANICKDTIEYPDDKEFTLICYCIMPNHVHLVFELLEENKGISKIMQSIKGISATRCNRHLGIEGQFWHHESYDRLIRDDKELYWTIRYVLMNPVEAGLVEDWRDWKHTYCHPDFEVL